jgi:hypothetical protein
MAAPTSCPLGCHPARPYPLGVYGVQAPTLYDTPNALLTAAPLELTRYPLFRYCLMDDLADDPERRRQWYLDTLGRYHGQLEASAKANRIPLRLLAAIVLNELADIDPRDKLQQALIPFVAKGSYGMSQIQIATARRHGLFAGIVEEPGDLQIAGLLAVPQYSIEAAAREIRHLLDVMEKDPTSPWPARFGFDPTGSRGRGGYYRPGVVAVGDPEKAEDREALFARMMASAYNGGEGFLGVADPKTAKPNSWIHGVNAETIARDLHRFDLFGEPEDTAAATAEPPPRPEPATPARRHLVRSGDSLSKLAQQYYGDAQLWPVIYQANARAIGPDPDRLRVGQPVEVPDIACIDRASLAEARRRAGLRRSPGTITVAPLR